MSLRRYSELKPSSGTTWPPKVRAEIEARDGGYCVAQRAGFPADVLARCIGRPTELDHVRAGGTGMKSDSIPSNGVSLDPWCHRWKTEHGREARPLLLEYLAQFYGGDCGHVDPVYGCKACDERRSA